MIQIKSTVGVLYAVAGLDRATFISLAAKFWSVGAGLLSLFFVSHYLSAEQQGFYYTFYSLIALQIFVELGLGYAIIQFASHEMIGLTWVDKNIALEGKPENLARLQSILKFSTIWYGSASLIILMVLIPVGTYFFTKSLAGKPIDFSVLLPWVFLVVVTAPAICLNAGLSILEGCNKVAAVVEIRFIQSICSVISVWCVLIAGGGLYSLAVGALMSVLIGVYCLHKNYAVFFRSLWAHEAVSQGISWRDEIWPFQWRIAVSWGSGYLIFQIFNPLLLYYHGGVAAGQMGMSLQILMAMNGAAAVWISTKIPMFGQLAAANQRELLNEVFFDALRRSLIFLVVGVFFVMVILVNASHFLQQFSGRILPINYFGVLMLIGVANHVVFAQASYLRANKVEPFMILSVVTGLATTGLAFLLVPEYSYKGAVFAYAIGAIVVSLGGGSYIFSKLHSQWTEGSKFVRGNQ